MNHDLLDLLPKLSQAEWVGIREIKETTTYRSARNSAVEENSRTISHGVMVEVLANGQIGYASTPEITKEGIARAAEQALLHAQKASAWKICSFEHTKARPATQGRYQSTIEKSFESMSPRDIQDLLIRITSKLKISPIIAQAQALSRQVDSYYHFVSSSGANIRQNTQGTSVMFAATAQKGTEVQTRTNGGYLAHTYQRGLEMLAESPEFWNEIHRVAEQAQELVDAPECPTKASDLMIMPDQMMLQIHETVGHPLEIDRILGDERNYAGSSFVKMTDFGKLKYGSTLMNVSFDPTVTHELASYAFDDTGLAATKEFLVKDGILVRGLGGLESQLRSQLSGVANARSTLWNRPPLDRMSNINLEPGTDRFEDMIASIEDGVLMESNRSWSIDDYRRKFQFGCEYGKVIKNGKISHTVRNPNYRGISVEFWNSLSKLGNRESWKYFGTPNCGKGEPNQIIRVGHGSPVCLFKNIEIFGGAA